MSRLKVVVTDQVFPDVEVERKVLEEIGADLVVADGTRDGALELAVDADALLNCYMPLDGDFIRSLKKAKIVARYGIGTDNVDLTAAADSEVVVTNVPDYCVEEVATHALTLILALVRRLPESQAFLMERGWGVDAIRPVSRFSDLTVGLLGYGRIARQLGGAVTALGATLITHDPFISETGDATEAVPFDELLARSNVLSLHCPLTSETRGIIDADALQQMPEGAVIVNTSRGPLVKLSDLIDALRSGHLRGAGLDVFEIEPPDPEQLRDVPGLIATPHTAFYSEASLHESQQKAATQVVKVFRGQKPDYPVHA